MKHSTVILLLLCAGLSLLCSCSGKSMSGEEASRFIAAYAPARIDTESAVRLEFTDLGRSCLKSDEACNAITFSPKAKGSASLSADKRFIDYKPEKPFKQGKNYHCRVDMKKLFGIDSLGVFEFELYVERREINIDDVRLCINPDNAAFVDIEGVIHYSTSIGDTVFTNDNILKTNCPRAKIALAEHSRRQKRSFKISGVPRKASDYDLIISVNPIAGFSLAETSVEIPSIGDFKLLSATLIDGIQPYINIEFSSPISPTQNIEGLVSIEGIDDIKLEKSGANIKAYYPVNGLKKMKLQIQSLLKNHEERRLGTDIIRYFEQEQIPPAIIMPLEGNILPDKHDLKLAFRSVNLAAVDVEVVKIFPTNIMSFLQSNDIDDTYSLRRYGRLIYRRTVRLDKDPKLDLHQWQNFSIDLQGLFKQDPGAIYNIQLSFCKNYSLYNKVKPDDIIPSSGLTAYDQDEWDIDEAYIYREPRDYDWNTYRWKEIDDPDKDTYYMCEERMPNRNVIASNLGLIVKAGEDNCYRCIVTDITSALPAEGVSVIAYNYQLQELARTTSNSQGFADLKLERRPYMIKATDGKSSTYLKPASGRELSTSNFNVSGKKTLAGIKAFTYGDRGVWRPGDDIYLTLIVDDRNKSLPENHPVAMELFTPDDRLYVKKTITKGVDGFYTFKISTDDDVPTGLWKANFLLGNQTFTHRVRIETIKPNRLKINISSPGIVKAKEASNIGIDTRWLTGPAAKDMNALLEMTLFADPKPFDNFKDFTFSNPLVDYESNIKKLFAGRTDSLGHIYRKCTMPADRNAPGMLQANIIAKVSENGGDMSISSKSVKMSPFDVYVGINLKDKEFETDTDIKLPVVALTADGSKVSNRTLYYKIYDLDYYSWREGNANYLSKYVSDCSVELADSGTVEIRNGEGFIPFRVNYPSWGRYFILVRDATGNHATGGKFIVDWPEWRGRAHRGSAEGSTELIFSLDKDKYEVGENVKVYLPKCSKGRVLLSVENGSRVLQRYWANTSATSETVVNIPVNAAMAPNFYISATLLQPHASTANDTPIRLWGVECARVIDKTTILHPEIEMPDVLIPQKSFTIKIREKNGKPMTYTLAIVDEGLLDITNFRTPQPWTAMNEREALGVKTFDMYNDVIGALGGRFHPVLSVGGDQALRSSAGKEKRFNPVVKFIGPVTLTSGVGKHPITLHNYVGSVRVMVVAAHKGTYGNADKTVKVAAPLMTLSTLPRIIACSDTVSMPVNVFVQNKSSVNVSLKASGPINIIGQNTKSIKFDSPDDKSVDFKLVANPNVPGPAKLIVHASDGVYCSNETINIKVQNPLPVKMETDNRIINPGEYTEFRRAASKKGNATLQLTTMPSLNFSNAMTFFENYPHLCTEQLSSRALFMLFGRSFLDDEKREVCNRELPKILKAIVARQHSNGGFVYWPMLNEPNEWVSSMAGEALCEAVHQGFVVDNDVIERWKAYQSREASTYRYGLHSDLCQAYRLYTLAMANKASLPAMNRLKESDKLNKTAAYCLSAAYACIGRQDVASKLIERANRSDDAVQYNFHDSSIRNRAFALEAFALTKQADKALETASAIAEDCKYDNYITQDLAFAAIAFSRMKDFLPSAAGDVIITQSGDARQAISGFKGAYNVGLTPNSNYVKVENKSNGAMNASLTTSRKPSPNENITAKANGVSIRIRYSDTSGKALNFRNIPQGTEFFAEIKVENKDGEIKDAALTYYIPSGWEIWNERLFGNESSDFSDIRDDRVNFYFSLSPNSEKLFKVKLRAAYKGLYFMPPTVCEDMYTPSTHANTKSFRVAVK